jgi:Na+/H+ antiporter NhaD/arsenite permease-like protein
VIDGFVLGSAECHGQCIALCQFSKYSLVVTMITVAISTGYLWLHCFALA